MYYLILNSKPSPANVETKVVQGVLSYYKLYEKFLNDRKQLLFSISSKLKTIGYFDFVNINLSIKKVELLK